MIVLGRITAPFGIKGWVRVHPFADDPAAWAKMRTWWLAPDADAVESGWREAPVLTARVHGDAVVAQLDGVSDRDGAEALEKMYVGAPRSSMPPPDAGEYYWADLIGLAVVNEASVSLGKVANLLETGANDVLVVRDGERERLLPFVEHVVREVDIPGRRIRVDWQLDW